MFDFGDAVLITSCTSLIREVLFLSRFDQRREVDHVDHYRPPIQAAAAKGA